MRFFFAPSSASNFAKHWRPCVAAHEQICTGDNLKVIHQSEVGIAPTAKEDAPICAVGESDACASTAVDDCADRLSQGGSSTGDGHGGSPDLLLHEGEVPGSHTASAAKGLPTSRRRASKRRITSSTIEVDNVLGIRDTGALGERPLNKEEPCFCSFLCGPHFQTRNKG